MSDKLSSNFANGLKELRLSYGWSLQKTADQTGISKSMLGQIERCESSPTISTIWKIATGFHLSFSEISGLLFEKSAIDKPINNHVIADPGFIANALMPFNSRTLSEIFAITVSPNIKHVSPPHNEGVMEHIIVVKGTLSILDHGEWKILNKGDFIELNGNQEHGYFNPSQNITKFHLIMHYLNEST